MAQDPFWLPSVAAFLDQHAPTIEARTVAEAVVGRTLLLELPLAGGEHLVLVRLHSRLQEREEIGIGSMLYNDWLRKSFLQAVEVGAVGSVLAVTNDLEEAYFLLVTRASVAELAAMFRAYLGEHLADLLLADDDPERGIHGDFKTMLCIPKSDFEPFPVYAVPRFLLRDLERCVRRRLLDLLDRPYSRPHRIGKDKLETAPSLEYRLIQSTMAFFYGRTSGGFGDCQSHDTFMARLATEYGVITPGDLCAAFNLAAPKAQSADALRQEFKNGIHAAIKGVSFNEPLLHALLKQTLARLAASIDEEPPLTAATHDDPPAGSSYLQSWFMPFIRSSHKPIAITCEDYLDALLHRVTLGPLVLALSEQAGGWPCRTCGDQVASVSESNILLGVSVNKFYNGLGSQPYRSGDRVCLRCALYSYLCVKRFGAMTIGKFPIPQQDNLIFHYGRHTPEKVQHLGRLLRRLLDLIGQLNQVRIEALAEDKQEGETRPYDLRRQTEDLERLLATQMEAGEQIAQEDLDRLDAMMQALMSQSGLMELLRQSASCAVLDLGVGEDRLMAFALPRLKEDLELADRRFVRARLTVYALIAFLQSTCGCNGPFFFRTVPRVAETPRLDHFYVGESVISGEEYRRRYAVAAAFAWRVTKGHGKDALKDWLGLSEQLAAWPLEVFAQVLRDSPVHGGDSAKEPRYRVLRNTEEQTVYDHDLHVVNGWEYLAAYQALRGLWRDSRQAEEEGSKA